ncbi:MAG: hypothetical protein Q8R47_00900 [Nanoarchaeota archaeon]|nr:hypothetical protein [Nanoarchaeota archaeon]
MEQQMYDNGGFTSGIYCKIIRPVKMEGVKTSIDSTETIIGSTETIISPLEAKTVMGGISQGDENSWIGNYDSAPRLYGSVFSPLEEGVRCDPDSWASDEEARAPSILDRIVSYINHYKHKRPVSKPDEKQAPAQKIVKPVRAKAVGSYL